MPKNTMSNPNQKRQSKLGDEYRKALEALLIRHGGLTIRWNAEENGGPPPSKTRKTSRLMAHSMISGILGMALKYFRVVLRQRLHTRRRRESLHTALRAYNSQPNPFSHHR
jgi:hypothetical protein